MFCIECGYKNPDKNAIFCTNCGYPFSHNNEEKASIEKETPVRTEKKRQRKGKKLLLIALISLCIIGTGSYFAINYMTDPMKKFTALENAVMEGEQTQFIDGVSFDENILLDETSYFEWMKTEEWDDVKLELLSIFKREMNVEEPTRFTAFSIEDEPLFYVDVTPYVFGLFHTYEVHAAPTKLLVPEDYLTLQVKIADESFDLTKMKKGETVLEVYPGVYPFEAVSTEDDEIVYDEKLLIEPYASLFIPITDGRVTYTFATAPSYDSAVLYINGKKSDYTLKALMEDGTLKARDIQTLHAEWTAKDGKITRSNTIYMDEMGESDTLSFEFDERNTSTLQTKDEKLLDIGSFILSFRDAYEDSVNEGNYQYIARFLQDGSEVEKELIQFVDDMNQASYYYDFKLNTVTDVKKKKDNMYEVKTNETFVFHDDDGLVYDYDRDKRYHVKEKDETYEIIKIDYIDTKKKVR